MSIPPESTASYHEDSEQLSHTRHQSCLVGFTRSHEALVECLPPKLLSAGALREFTSLSRENKDGWGLAWHDDADVLRMATAPESAQVSAELDQLTETTRTDSLVMHLRSATRGFGLDLEDTYPFVRNGCHNGAVKSVGGLEELVLKAERASFESTTDSERYFLATMNALGRDGVNKEVALREILHAVDEWCAYTSLNCLLLAPDRLYAVCCYDAGYPDAQVIPGQGPGLLQALVQVPSSSPRRAGAPAVSGRPWRASRHWRSSGGRSKREYFRSRSAW